MRLIIPRARLSRSPDVFLAWNARCRSYAVQASGGPGFQVFNRRAKWLQKERAAANVEASRQADYLRDEIASRVCERLLVRSQLPPRSPVCRNQP